MKDAISTVGDVVRHYAQSKPDHPAIVFGSRTTTYAQLNRFSNQVARGLSAPDNCKDNRIAYLGKNTDYYYELFLAVPRPPGFWLPSIGVWRHRKWSISSAMRR